MHQSSVVLSCFHRANLRRDSLRPGFRQQINTNSEPRASERLPIQGGNTAGLPALAWSAHLQQHWEASPSASGLSPWPPAVVLRLHCTGALLSGRRGPACLPAVSRERCAHHLDRLNIPFPKSSKHQASSGF